MKYTWAAAMAMAALCIGCSDASEKLQESIAADQLRQGQREKNMKMVQTAFDAYVESHADFEVQRVSLVHCGEIPFVTARQDEVRSLFDDFMVERVEAAMKDREPVRTRANETEQDREFYDNREAWSRIRALDLLMNDQFHSYLRQTFNDGILTTYYSLAPSFRNELCSAVDQYKTAFTAVLDQHAKDVEVKRAASAKAN